MANYKVGNTFEEIRDSFLKKEVVSKNNWNGDLETFLSEDEIDNIIRFCSGEHINASWPITGGLVGITKLVHGFSPDLTVKAFYFPMWACVGFLFEQDGVIENDFAYDARFSIDDVAFDLSDMAEARKAFWSKVADIYANTVLAEAERKAEEKAYGPVMW